MSEDPCAYSVYAYVFDDGHAYVGLTNNLKQRSYNHKYDNKRQERSSPVLKYWKKSGQENFPDMLVLYDGLSAGEAQRTEGLLVSALDPDLVLNKAPTGPKVGSLGGKPRLSAEEREAAKERRRKYNSAYSKKRREKPGFRLKRHEQDREYWKRHKAEIRERQKEWSERNRGRQKEYYLKNRKRLLEKCKAYRLEHRDRICEQLRAYRKKNHTSVVEGQREWYWKNREKVLEKNREYRRKNRDLLNARRRARRRKAREDALRLQFDVGSPTFATRTKTRQGDKDMKIESFSSGKIHKLLKRQLREMWARVKARFADVLVALIEMKERIERSVRIQNLLQVLESRGRHDLIACAYNGVRFA